MNDYFRSRFESDLPKLHGYKGIGVISDHDPQPPGRMMTIDRGASIAGSL